VEKPCGFNQRSRYRYLNHFTTEQLVILQSELAKLIDAKKPDKLDKRVFHILHGVGQQYTCDELTAALRAALTDSGQAEEDAAFPVIDDSTDFISYLDESGYSKSLALRALQSGISPDQRQEGTPFDK
jgi:hypothetical protein